MYLQYDKWSGVFIVSVAIFISAFIAGTVLDLRSDVQPFVVGEQAAVEPFTAVRLFGVYGVDAELDGSLDTLYVGVNLVGGSSSVLLDDVLVTYRNGQISQELTLGSCGVTTFGYSYLNKGDQFVDGYLSPGDVVRLCFTDPQGVSEGDALVFTFIPREGSVERVSVSAPAIEDSTVTLYS